MKDLRVSLFFLLVALAFFFNVERLDLGDDSVVNLATPIYPLVTIAALLTISLRFLARFNLAVTLSGWAVLYLAVKVLGKGKLLGDPETYVTISEITLTLGIAWICHHVARGLTEFEVAVEEVTMKALGHRFIPLRDAGERIQDEFQLSRRHAFPLSVIVVEPDARSMKMILHRMLKEAQQALKRVFAIRSAASVITKTLRRTDLLLEDDNPARFIVLCRDTNEEGAVIVQRRIREACTRELGLTVSTGRSCFPDEALTFEELMQSAASKMRESDAEVAAASGENTSEESTSEESTSEESTSDRGEPAAMSEAAS